MANASLQTEPARATSVSRRALLTATPVIATSILLAVPVGAQADGTDTDFWRIHTKWTQIRADWNADTDPDDDAVFQRWDPIETKTFQELIAMPVVSAAAILAKYKASNYDNCLPEIFALKAIEADLMAFAAREEV